MKGMEVIAKIILFLSSIWIYVPIIVGIFGHMIWMIPLAYTSWILFLSLGGDWAELPLGVDLTGDLLPLGICVLILVIVIFIAGVTLLVWGHLLLPSDYSSSNRSDLRNSGMLDCTMASRQLASG